MSGQAAAGGQAMRRLAEDHPAAAGHFPGNPIIPGAVLLAEVIAAIGCGDAPWLAPLVIRSAKFLRPVRPGDVVIINWTSQPEGDTRFACQVEDRTVLTGTLRLGQAPGA